MSNPIQTLPRFIREYAHSLPSGMYTPMSYPREITPGNIPFVVFVGNAGDQVVNDVDNNPIVEIRLGVRSREVKAGSAIVLVWFFLSIEGSSGTTYLYEIGFNIGDPDIWQDLNTISNQPFYEIITCGDTLFTATRVSLPSLGIDVARVISLAQRHLDVGWSQDEYMTALQAEWASHPDIESLVQEITHPKSRRFDDIL